MIKSISLVHRKAGLSREEYNRYWKERHGPLAASIIPGLRKYVQNHFIQVPGLEYEGDGIVEMWYDTVEDFRKSLEFVQSDAGRELAQDGDSIADMKPGFMWVVEEHVIKDEIG